LDGEWKRRNSCSRRRPCYLGKIGSLHLLSVFERVVLPETVHEEISARGLPRGMEKLEYELVKADEEERFSNLDRGESAALSVAQELDDEVVFLTDDLEAREKAKNLGIEVHGSVGVVVLGFKKAELEFEEATSKIRGLAEETEMFITDAVVEQGIRILEELKE
jgi:predicted nucleic acid-binding protein